MQVKKIKPNQSAILYNSNIDELILISELKFMYSENIFFLDQNPHGESLPTKLNNLKSNEDFSVLNFQCNFRNSEVEFSLESDHYYDKTIFKSLANSEFRLAPIKSPKRDKIQLFFSHGEFNKAYFYKYKDYKLLDALTILNENGNLFLVKQNPWSKNEIKEFKLLDDNIACELNDEYYNFKLETQSSILGMLEGIINQI